MNINGVTNIIPLASLVAQASTQASGHASAPPVSEPGGNRTGATSAGPGANRAGSTSVTQLADGATITTVRNTSQAIISVTTAQQAAGPASSLQPAQTTVSTVDIIA